MEYFASGTYSKGECDTLTYMYKTWPELQFRVGRGGKRRQEIIWPLVIAWAYVTPACDTVLCEAKGVIMPFVTYQLHLGVKYVKT